MVMVYVVPAAIAALSWALAHFLSRHQPNRGVYALLALDLVALVALILQGRAADGWDGIGYVIFAMLAAVPIAIGLLLGLLTGFYVRRKASRRD